MNGLYINCAIAASTLAASTLLVEMRLKKFDEMIAQEGPRLNQAAEEAISAEKKTLETYDATMRAAAGAIDSRRRAEAAEVKARVASSANIDLARVFIAERDKTLTGIMEAKFKELEAKLRTQHTTHVASDADGRAGDLDAAVARSDALAKEMKADNEMKAVKAREAAAASDDSDGE